MEAAFARVAQTKQYVSLLVMVFVDHGQKEPGILGGRRVAVQISCSSSVRRWPRSFLQVKKRDALGLLDRALEFEFRGLADVDQGGDLETDDLFRYGRRDFENGALIWGGCRHENRSVVSRNGV